MTTVEVPDTDGLYAQISGLPRSRAFTRTTIEELGKPLALAVDDLIVGADEHEQPPAILCVVILRGGALLYPSFAAQFADADFLMLGLQRVQDAVICDYRTTIAQGHYRHILFIDCVAATGNTILAARAALTASCVADGETAAVICSSTVASDRLSAEGIGLVGYSLRENVSLGVVSPDLGELDAGDLFSSASHVSNHLDAAPPGSRPPDRFAP